MLASSRSQAQRAAPALRAAVRHMSGKDLRFGDEARALMLKGVDQLANAVQVRRPKQRCLGAVVLLAVEG
jgi:chaperonin GroEL